MDGEQFFFRFTMSGVWAADSTVFFSRLGWFLGQVVSAFNCLHHKRRFVSFIKRPNSTKLQPSKRESAEGAGVDPYCHRVEVCVKYDFSRNRYDLWTYLRMTCLTLTSISAVAAHSWPEVPKQRSQCTQCKGHTWRSTRELATEWCLVNWVIFRR